MASTTAVALLLIAQAVAIDLPTSDLFFYETFDDGKAFSSGRWVKSGNSRYAEQQIEVIPHKPINENLTASYEGDLSLLLARGGATYYGVATKFPTVLETKDEELVIQYDVKLEEGLTCGGAYIKLLREQPLNLQNLNDKSPYTIMFGPDKCGGTNKVHFILQHQNPISKQWEEKHFKDAPLIKSDKKTHLYTLRITPDNNFEIYIDKHLAKSGNLLNDMTPPVNPPKMIDDPTDKKPADWVDEATIPDPTASKPDDWDEDAPMFIEDEDAVKPDNWYENEPEMIPDPAAQKPEDWDDEEDGTWEAPLVSNPLCEQAAGCGEWQRPKIRNPAYKGKWKAPMIDNPEYKGEWSPRQIENPHFFVDEHPHNVAPITGLAVEVMTTNPNIRMDNFVIAYSLDAAFKFADATMAHKLNTQKTVDEQEAEEERKREREEKLAQGGWANVVEVFLSENLEILFKNPVAVIATLVGAFVALIYIAFPRKARTAREAPAAPAPEEKKEGEKKEEKEGEKKEEKEEIKTTEETTASKAAPPGKKRSARAD